MVFYDFNAVSLISSDTELILVTQNFLTTHPCCTKFLLLLLLQIYTIMGSIKDGNIVNSRMSCRPILMHVSRHITQIIAYSRGSQSVGRSSCLMQEE